MTDCSHSLMASWSTCGHMGRHPLRNPPSYLVLDLSRRYVWRCSEACAAWTRTVGPRPGSSRRVCMRACAHVRAMGCGVVVAWVLWDVMVLLPAFADLPRPGSARRQRRHQACRQVACTCCKTCRHQAGPAADRAVGSGCGHTGLRRATRIHRSLSRKKGIFSAKPRFTVVAVVSGMAVVWLIYYSTNGRRGCQ